MGAGLCGKSGAVVFTLEAMGGLICGRTTAGETCAGLVVARLLGLVIRSGTAGALYALWDGIDRRRYLFTCATCGGDTGICLPGRGGDGFVTGGEIIFVGGGGAGFGGGRGGA